MSTNTIDSATNSIFHTSRMPQTVVLHTHHGRKGNKLNRRQEWKRETRQNESEIKNKKQGWRY